MLPLSTPYYVIDYSFVIWIKFSSSNSPRAKRYSIFDATQLALLDGWNKSVVTESLVLNDPWNLANIFMDSVQASPNFVVGNNYAYSIVLSQTYSSTSFYARLCMVGKNFYYSKIDSTDGYLFENPQGNVLKISFFYKQ